MNRALAALRLLRVGILARAEAARLRGLHDVADALRTVHDDVTALIEILRRR
jgi:hypothetical protein